LTEPAAASLRVGGAWSLAAVAVTLSSGLVRTIVVARFLAPVDIGLMGIALLAVGFLEAVASTGLDSALVASRKDVESYIDPAFTIQVARGFIVMTLLWAAAPALAWAFHNDAATPVIRSVSVVAALRGFANPATALAVRRLDFRRVFWWSLPEALTALGITIALAVLRRDVWALVVGVIAGQVVATIASYGLVRRMPRLVLARQRIHELFQFGRFVSGSRALMYFSVNLDAAVVGVSMGTHELGLYQFATRVAELPVVTFTRAVGQVALPALSSVEVGTAGLRRTWRTLLGWTVIVNAGAAVLIVLFGGVVVDTVAGSQWRDAVPVLRILAVAMVCRAVLVLTGQLLDGANRPALTMRLNAVRLAALVVLLPQLAIWKGVTGVAQGVLLVNAGTALLALRLSADVLASEQAVGDFD